MKKSIICLTLILFGCASPNIIRSTKNLETDLPKGLLLNADLQSGERFYFNVNGGQIITLQRQIFGKTESGNFLSIGLAQCKDTSDILTQWRNTRKIDMITLNSGDKYTFRNSEYYENAKFLTGYTSSGVKILIPMSKVTAIELMKNAEAVETSENTKIFFGTIAVIGLVVLKVWAKMKSEE